jgi:hypothetical protein
MNNLNSALILLAVILTSGCQTGFNSRPTLASEIAIARNAKADSYHVAFRFVERNGLRKTTVATTAIDVQIGMKKQVQTTWKDRQVVAEILIQKDHDSYVDRKLSVHIPREDGTEGHREILQGSFRLSPSKDKLYFAR